MQVNQTSHHHLPISESSFELKEGEVYRATIKEKLTDNEAVLQIKGKELLAKFEDGVPSGNRVTILVSDRKEQMVNVKTIAADNMKAGSQVVSEEKILQSIGLTGKESPVVKQSVQILLDKGAPISKEIVNGLKGFMETAQGSNEEKIETVKALANKRLDATQVQLRAVHEALHGKPLNEVLSNLAKEINPKFKLEPKETVSKSQQEPVVQRGTTPSAKEVEPVKVVQPQAASNPTNEGIKKDNTAAQVSELVRNSREFVEKEPDLRKAIQQIREDIIKNPKIDRESAQKIEKAALEAEKLQSIGKDRLIQALKNAEAQLLKIEQQPDQSKAQQQPAAVELLKQDAQQVREFIQQVRAQAQAEPDINKILQKVQDQIINNKRIDPELVRDIERLAKQATQLDQAGRERLTKILEQVEALLKQNETQAKIPKNSSNSNVKDQSAINNQQISNSAKNAEGTDQTKTNEIRPSELIKQALKQLQKEPDLERALNQVRKEITSHPNIDLKTIDKAEKAINHATQLQDKGREIAARQNITKELTQMEQELAKTEPAPTTSQKATLDVQYDINEQLQSLNIQSKDIIVTKVTQKLAQATHDFRELKREISRNLDNVEHLINTYKKNAYPQAKQMLETAISKLDNAILKSEMMLLTDMKTEKQLMQASAQLAEAKKLLSKGDHAEAGKIVSEVKILVDKLIFKPTEQKMMHFVNKESMALENRSPSQQMLSQFGDTARGFANQEPSARQMFEMVRSLGLNHDSDVANSLVFQKNEQSLQEQQQQQNLKAALLKLTQGEETNSKVVQQAEQALTNLTGQQLLSKSDANGTLQSMFFNLPMMLGEKPENLQVFINSKNEGQQVDWENCNLYFLLETKKLGDVGILLNTTDRNLSITIKNDLPGFKERMEPLASFTKEKLKEVGYNVGSIQFTRMSSGTGKSTLQEESETQTSRVKKSRPVFTEKGMDFKI
ncbi:hypothetical protein ACFYKT_09090 [Cytobacillus sp. FJAT-53684]|uniref:Flagellar hook-length control protein-like C-terminal domain-containing protein n=1 Tax=Cytobacillus mangrovibacter TaxID=3299024 RepID=A0ABW6JYA3_9BACI